MRPPSTFLLDAHAQKSETRRSGRNFRRTVSGKRISVLCVYTFDALYARLHQVPACARSRNKGWRQWVILIFATVPPRLPFSLRYRASVLALCRLLVNRVGAFLIYVCASGENAIGRSRAFARRYAAKRLERFPDCPMRPSLMSAMRKIAF